MITTARPLIITAANKAAAQSAVPAPWIPAGVIWVVIMVLVVVIVGMMDLV